MAAPIDLGHLTQMLQCGICKNTLSNPKSLRCSHSFCKLCLDGLMEFIEGGSGVLKCPNADCGKSSFLSCDQTTNDLQVDHIVKGIVSMVKKSPEEEQDDNKVKCEICVRNEVSKYCIRCKEYRCDTCKDDHNDILDAFISVRFEKKKLKIFCQEHKTEAKYTCTCGKEEFICVYCAHRGHKSHNYETFTDGEKTLKGMLANRITFSDDLDKQWTEAQDDMTTARSYLHELLLINKINCINEYVDFVNKEEEKLKHDFDLLTAFHTKSFSSTVDSIEYFKDCLTRDTMDLLLERAEIKNKLNTSMGKSRKIPEVTVSLTSPDFKEKNPLGLMSIRVYGKRFFVSGSRKTFKSDMPEPKVRDPSLQTLESLLKEVLYLPPDFKIDDPSSLAPPAAVDTSNMSTEKLGNVSHACATAESSGTKANISNVEGETMQETDTCDPVEQDDMVSGDERCPEKIDTAINNKEGTNEVVNGTETESITNKSNGETIEEEGGVCVESGNSAPEKKRGRRKRVVAKKTRPAEKKAQGVEVEDMVAEAQNDPKDSDENEEERGSTPIEGSQVGDGVVEVAVTDVDHGEMKEIKKGKDDTTKSAEVTAEDEGGFIVIDDENDVNNRKEAKDGSGADDQTEGYVCIDEVYAGDAEEKGPPEAAHEETLAKKKSDVDVSESEDSQEEAIVEKKEEPVTNMNGKPEVGVIRFVVENVSRVRNTVLSDPVTIQNLSWRIMLMPQYSENDGGRIVRNAGIFVQCDPAVEGSSWLCQAHGKITLKNKNHDDMTKKITEGIFTNEHSCWGHSSFVPWVDILDTRKGFSRGDTVTIEAVVEVDPPLFFKTARVYSNAQSSATNTDRDAASRKRKLSDEKNTDLLELLCRKKEECDYSTVKVDRGFGKAIKQEKF